MPLRVQVTLGDLRRKTADLPDDTAVFIEYESCYDWREIDGLGMKYLAPVPIMDVPGALILSPGSQDFDEEHHIGPRFDVYLDCGEELLKP